MRALILNARPGSRTVELHLEALADAGFREILTRGEDVTTMGAIRSVLPLLGTAPFLVIDGSSAFDFPPGRLRSIKCDHAHLVLRPADPGSGEFSLRFGRVTVNGERDHRFSGTCVCHPRIFEGVRDDQSLLQLLQRTADTHLVTGEAC